MTIVDPLPALVEYLEAELSSPVFGGQLPSGETPTMPHKAVVVKSAGGPFEADYSDKHSVRLDVRCYGASSAEANELYYEVHTALKDMRAHSEAGVKLLSCSREFGPLDTVEPAVPWPVVISFWTLMARGEPVGV